MKELNAEVKQQLLAPFQAAEVRVRTHPYVAAYISARVVQTRLDEVLPWQWSFRLTGPGVIDGNGVMHQDGVLLIHRIEGPPLEYHERGSSGPDAAKGQAKQAKGAVSDCFKRCAVHAGVGRYMYELQGVQGGRVPKAALAQALAAVGYAGKWDDRHHGPIGGIREADLEDEDMAPGGETSAESPASALASEEQLARIRAAIEASGGKPASTHFRAWLGKNTSNHATVLSAVLAEDVEGLVAKLDALAAKAKRRSA